MMKEITLAEWMDMMAQGLPEDPSRKNVIEAGWFDWFCSDKDLVRRTKNFYHALALRIPASWLLSSRIHLKNVCPCEGPLYDYMYIENVDTGVELIIEHKNRKWKVYENIEGCEQENVIPFGNIAELSKYLSALDPKEIEERIQIRKKNVERHIDDDFIQEIIDGIGYHLETIS